MSADTKGKKRKSGDNIAQPAKKVKTTTTTVKSADRPAPAKSALKKSKVETTVTEKAKDKKSKAEPKVKKVVEKIEEVEPVVSDDDEDDGGAELTADQTADLLAGFSSDESGDEDGDEGVDVATLPAAPTTGEVQKAITKASKQKSDDAESTPGVVYISRLPHGFFEKQLRAYFSQFGTITHLRLARNRKTGKSKHYTFIEFEAASVADIVAKTMDKYLLFGHILQCKRIPAEQVKDEIWKGPKGVKNAKVRPRNRIEGSKLRKGTDREGWEKRITREEQRRQSKQEKLKELGYDFDMPAVKGVDAVIKQKVVKSAVAEAGAEKEDSGVKLVEEQEQEPMLEETVVATIKSGPKGKAVVEEKTTKRKTKAGGEKITKKQKTKA
ncbi:putative RNA-binding protein [Pseudocercospora fuligena]|uniref:Putative RNA-binding protein n=1 Tax=Pseudocercospora fuligena TaxID=685502 RepID=A0A8H6VC14_9PEZI|nr:putative RNA-binding protein [Pseudocercospora fuligena]